MAGPPAGRVGRRTHVAGTQVKILVPGNHLMAGLLGQRDELLRLVEGAFDDVRIAVRGNEISIEGDGAERVGALFEELILLLESGQGLDAVQVNRTIDMMDDDLRPSEVLTAEVLRSSRGRTVRPKTGGSEAYADAIASNIVTFGIGPAGPASRIWPWPWPSRPSRPGRSTASS